MTRDELFQAISDLSLEPNHLLYIERRGQVYTCRQINSADNAILNSQADPLPDTWIYYSGPWPSKDADPGRWQAFFEDLLAEMESMAGGIDRCRWPLDEPWPHRH